MVIGSVLGECISAFLAEPDAVAVADGRYDEVTADELDREVSAPQSEH